MSNHEILDVLAGTKSTIVRTTEHEYEFDTDSEGNLLLSAGLPIWLVSKLEDRDDVSCNQEDSRTISHVVQQPATDHIRNITANKLEASPDSTKVQRIADIGFEVPMRVEVKPRSIKITHVFKKELNEPHVIYTGR